MDRTATIKPVRERVISLSKLSRAESGGGERAPRPEIEAEMARIQSMNIAELRTLWHVRFKGSLPPKAYGPDLLRRALAHKIQEDAYGGLDAKIARILNQLIAQSEKSPGKITLPRRMKAGTIIVREWQGKRHSVTVAEDGFRFDGKSFDSLSEIAREITGTRWNGPRFFGLRAKEEQADAA